MMVYFRVLPVKISELDEDFMFFFFKFANTYTEESILTNYSKMRAEKEVSEDDLKELGYTDEDILNMD